MRAGLRRLTSARRRRPFTRRTIEAWSQSAKVELESNAAVAFGFPLPGFSVNSRFGLRQLSFEPHARMHDGVAIAAPAGTHVTMGLDPGLRTGVKVAVVDETGQVVITATVYPHEPQRRWDEAVATLGRLAREHVRIVLSLWTRTVYAVCLLRDSVTIGTMRAWRRF